MAKILNKQVLRKTLWYKAGGICITCGVLSLILGKPVKFSLGVAACAEIATTVYYYIFESLWRNK